MWWRCGRCKNSDDRGRRTDDGCIAAPRFSILSSVVRPPSSDIMRVLAIDTALDACSAAVLDSDRQAIMASETLTMQRGHAEALMPLIARVMDSAAIEFKDLDR